MHNFTIKANYVNIPERSIYPAIVIIQDGIITSVEKTDDTVAGYILPGFIDAHVHIESSMLVPSAFAKTAVVHGTVATVSDPHEIANVCGIPGVQYMIDDSKKVPFKFFFGAPSCVPATGFETAGATIDSKGIEELLNNPDIWYLAEMMNFPGVLYADKEVMAKIAAAKKAGKPVDGHAPGLRDDDALKYAAAGITTDHECFAIEEAQDKLLAGMKIIIREGSAARNFEELVPLFKTHPEKLMFCSDDKHPDELVLSHINALVKRAIAAGYDTFDVLRAACINPVLHYGLPVGTLKKGDAADFILVDNLTDLNVNATYINGQKVAEHGTSLIEAVPVNPINNFHAEHKQPENFVIPCNVDNPDIRVIQALDGQLITNLLITKGKVENDRLVSDTENDILKMVVINRYTPDTDVATAFIKNFGLKHGALASTVGHDCHNIIAVGVEDESICKAVNALIDCKGGISVVNGNNIKCMPLPIAGLMSDKDGASVALEYSELDKEAKALGSKLRAPYMTLSFMALLVIPSLKLSDKGLFDGSKFEFTSTVVG